MAVGYEKVNTSGARAKRRANCRANREIPREQITVTPAGVKIWDATYKSGKTLEAFVSDCDKVRCEFECGYVVTLRGSVVRVGIANREKKDE